MQGEVAKAENGMLQIWQIDGGAHRVKRLFQGEILRLLTMIGGQQKSVRPGIAERAKPLHAAREIGQPRDIVDGQAIVIINAELADFRGAPEPEAEVVMRAERGVIARVQQCIPDWCRLSVEGEKGWVSTAALWGVDPGELIE